MVTFENLFKEVELLQGIKNNTVYVIYTKDGPYETLPTKEAAEDIAKLDGLTDYQIIKETYNKHNNRG